MTEPVSGADSHPQLTDDAEPVSAPKPSTWRVLLNALSPKTVWQMSDGYPVVLKQFIQFCLILVYPVLWVLFWPMRAWMKKNRPEEYAESQRKK